MGQSLWSAAFIAKAFQTGQFSCRHKVLVQTSEHQPLKSQQASLSSPVTSAAVSNAVAAIGRNPLVSEKVGKAGGGDGDEPTPEEQFQVAMYRFSFFMCALSWLAVFNLDFLMTSGIDIIDGSLQVSILRAADVFAGLAACFAPTGSLIGVGVLLKLIGLVAMASSSVDAVEFQTLGKLAGPSCLVLLFAREIYWYGLTARGGLIVGVLTFAYVAFLRCNSVMSGVEQASMVTETMTSDKTFSIAEPLSPIGPPVVISGLGSLQSFVTAFSKVFDPVGEELDEEGEKGFKRSSRDLSESGFPSFKPDLSAWLPPVEKKTESQTSAVDADAKATTPVLKQDQNGGNIK